MDYHGPYDEPPSWYAPKSYHWQDEAEEEYDVPNDPRFWDLTSEMEDPDSDMLPRFLGGGRRGYEHEGMNMEELWADCIEECGHYGTMYDNYMPGDRFGGGYYY
jgi:hypothetical protein